LTLFSFRPQGEEIYTQAIRHFLALAERSRQNRERIFLESVINRKIVITERKIVALFQKLGFFFAIVEAQEVVKYFRSVQVCLLKRTDSTMKLTHCDIHDAGQLLAQSRPH